MFAQKNYIIIGLTTFHNEMLRVSVPPLAKFARNIFLIIHNDNPGTTITKRHIRKLGYRGKLYIINASKNIGLMGGRLAILDAVKKLKIKSNWMMFADDDDIVTDIDIPTAPDHNFAVMQNMAIIRSRLIDLFQIMDDPANCITDEENIVTERPHVGMAGTLVRTDIVLKLGKRIRGMIDAIEQIDATLGHRVPVDAIMWSYLNMYAKHLNPGAAPIYMDKINYIAWAGDSAIHKYGKKQMPPKDFEPVMRKYCALFEEMLKEENTDDL